MPIISNFPGGSGSGGGGLALGAVSNIKTLTASGKVYVKWTDPDDMVVGEATLAAWGGTLLVRKAGSMPTSRRDGTTVLDSKERNKYQNAYFCDTGLTNGTTYFYKLFPYSTSNTYTNSSDGEFSATPNAVALGNVTGITLAAAGNGKLSIKWTDPAATVVEDGVTLATWASTVVVVKAGSYAISPEDPEAAYTFKSTTRNAYTTNPLVATGLSNGTTYYVSLFPTSTDGFANTNTSNRATGVANRMTIATVPSQSGTLTYNTNPQSPSWSNYNNTQLTIGGTTSGTNAGNYNATFTPKDDYMWSDGSTTAKTVAWTIGKADITVPTTNSAFTYDGEVKTPVWTGYDSTKMTMSGSTFGTDAGTYTTTFTPTDNYQWSDKTVVAKNVNWSIAKAEIVDVPAQSGTLIYTGSQQSPSWSNYDSAKLTIGGEINGTNAGDYSATFTPTKNYQWSGGSVAAKTVKWTIGRATIGSVPAQSGTLTYSGTAQTPSWTGYDTTKMTIGGVTSGTDAGSYNAEFTPNSNYQWSDKTTTKKTVAWTISRASVATIPSQDGTLTYSGKVQSPTWKNHNTAQLTLGGATSGTNAGNYDATFTPTNNYQWSDGSTTARTVSWTIGRLAVTAAPAQSNTLTYNGSSQSPTWSNAENFTISGTTSSINAGTYSASFTPTANYTWQDGTTVAKNVSWTIGRATITTVPSQSGTLTYSGSSQSPSWSNYDTGKMTIGGTTSGINAGNYNATFTPTSNYKWNDSSTTAKTVAWTIGKATVALPTQSGSLTYTGSEQTPSWSGYDAAKLTIGGTTKGTNAGSYNATFTPTSNYQWSDGGTAAKTATWSIGKASGILSVNPTSVTLNTSTLTATVTVTRAGSGTISAVSNDTSVAKVTVSGTTLNISHVNQTSGTATITVSVAADNNYNAPANKTVTVSAQFMPEKKNLNDMSWADISAVSEAGKGSEYWSVGDRKGIVLNGTVGTLNLASKTLYVYILGFDHNSDKEGRGIHFGTFKDALTNGNDVCLVDSKYSGYDTGGTKYFNMNHKGNYNYGGWAACDLRYDVLGSTDKAPSNYPNAKSSGCTGQDASATTATQPVAGTLMAALPEDLRAVMKPMTKYTDNVGGGTDVTGNISATLDYLPLLSEQEIFGGNRSWSNQYEKNYQAQYAYYAASNAKIKKRHDNTGTAAFWWERSPYYDNNVTFCRVSTNGTAYGNYAWYSYGLAPAFKV